MKNTVEQFYLNGVPAASVSAASLLDFDNGYFGQEDMFYSDGKKYRISAPSHYDKQIAPLSCQFINAQEMERKRIAAELHDGICQTLGVIKYKIEGVLAAAGNSHLSCFDQLQHVTNDIRGAMDEVRKIAMDLRPSILDDLGLLRTIDWFCREFQSTYTNIKIEKKITIQESSFIEELKLAVYRIIQEAMNNIIKYAEANLILLELNEKSDGIYLQISDNGQGFDIDAAPREPLHGFGLRNMHERARLTGGRFNIISVAGVGTTIDVMWPLDGLR